MAPTKRMSADEKRQVILGIYHQTKAVYTEKEIIVLASKAGVTQNTIADINQSLVDDGLVDKEKIGGSNYFWSFPEKADYQTQVRHQETLAKVNKLTEAVKEVQARLADAKRGREDDGGERPAKLMRLSEIAKERATLQAELDVLKENDPQALADLEKELKLVKEAANRWTDNIFNCKDYLVKKRGMDRKEVLRILGITSAFDYPEDKIPK